MNEKILLINPSYKSREHYFPLGLGYIAGACAQAGITVECLDLNMGNLTTEHIRKKIRNDDFFIIGIGGFSTQLKSTIELSNAIKDACPDVIIIVGGLQAFGCDNFIFNHSRSDIVCMGESEIILPDLIHKLYQGEDLSKIPSIKYRYKNKVLGNGEFYIIPNLNELPFPKYDAFHIDYYIENNYHRIVGKRTIDFICSRGCLYKCSYCINSKKPVKMRYRSIDNILAEIRFLKTNYRINDFSFADEIFTINKHKALEICEALQTEDITWLTSVRADGINDELLSAMKKGGCRMLLIGFESGSESILKSMNKKVKLETYYEAIKLLREYDVSFFPNFMIGMPDETEETIKETEKLCIDNDLIFGPSYVTPFPGSKLYDDIKDNIDEKEYLMSLSNLNFSKKPIINLSKMDTANLIYLRNRAVINTTRSILKKKLKYIPTRIIELALWSYLYVFNIDNPFLSKMIRSLNKIISQLCLTPKKQPR